VSTTPSPILLCYLHSVNRFKDIQVASVLY
jgi:hypothetical protein